MKKQRLKFVVGTAFLLSLTTISFPVFAVDELKDIY